MFALQDVAWRGTSGCSINITSGSRRHMTPKWAFQRRVNGILRFAILLLPRPVRRRHTAARPENAVQSIRCIASTMAARGQQRTWRIRASSVPPLSAGPGNSCTSWESPPFHKPDPWLANHIQQRTSAFSYQFAHPRCGGSSPPAPKGPKRKGKARQNTPLGREGSIFPSFSFFGPGLRFERGGGRKHNAGLMGWANWNRGDGTTGV
ncbi:hypothetical protein V8C35DRAFT_289915 [Trichoderma chlorosporum]